MVAIKHNAESFHIYKIYISHSQTEKGKLFSK